MANTTQKKSLLISLKDEPAVFSVPGSTTPLVDADVSSKSMLMIK
jgi:hypothetical protein